MFKFKNNLPTVLVCLIFSSTVLFGQETFFETYKPLRSEGKIPDAFIMTTSEKIAIDIAEKRGTLSREEEQIFFDGIHFGIDELLQSGIVLFGDPTTKYVQKVADNLLKDNRKLKKQLQFYVIKSNVTNALSTDQGIIFVTLGLLAQLENEAQLAFVLSHEIAHFSESHVEQSYQERISVDREDSYDTRITKLSNYSKDNELEADKLSLKLYHKAGYSKDELLSAFDVLIYSYLPFDEVAVPKAYFNNDLLFIPEIFFPNEINPIKADEDYDDSKSSHPNIRKRKNAVINELDAYSSWGDKEFILSKEEFIKIRTIARFENIRIDLIDHRYGDALYSIYLLEKKYPNNLYLQTSKGKAWLGLSRFKKYGSYSTAVTTPSKVEGESHSMQYLLKKLKKIQLYTVSMRMIEDIRKSFPNDESLKKMSDDMIKILANYSRFKIGEYSELNYLSALEEFEQSKLSLIENSKIDSLEGAENRAENGEELSKYDKIKLKKNHKVATSEEEEFDEAKFHLFALSDLVKDEDFKRKLRMYMEVVREEKESNKKEIVTDLVLIEPYFVSHDRGSVKVERSERVKGDIIDVIIEQGRKFNINIYDQTNHNLNAQTTEQFNTKSILNDFIRQRIDYSNDEMFSVDFSELKLLQEEFGNGQIMFIYGSIFDIL